QPGRLETGLARADVRVEPGRDVVAVLRTVLGEGRVDGRRVLAVGDDGHRRVAEDRVQGVRGVDQHVAGGGAHEHLQPGRGARIDAAHRFEVVVAGAEVEAVVGARPPGGAGVLVLQRRG